MLIFSVLKTLTGQEVTVELKNDLSISGKLKSVDQSVIETAQLLPSHAEILLSKCLYRTICTGHGSTRFLNIKLDDIAVQQPERYPHLLAVKNMFIRGSVVRYVQLPKAAVDTQLLEDATRREAANQKGR